MRFTSKLRTSVLLLLLLCAGAYAKDLSVADGETWYAANKEALIKLHNVVLQNPEILRVEPALSIRYIPNNKTFTPETMTVYKEIEKQCVSLGIKHIAVARELNSSSGELIAVTYTLSSGGLSVSGGRFLSIKYFPSECAISKRYTSEYIVKPLDEENWYLVDYRDGRK